jgi:VIT1/CCC1 family predicted Fe2+/Mn2+ transporter
MRHRPRDPGRTPSRGRAAEPMRIDIEPVVADRESDAAELSERISKVAKGGARAAVLGINDGLVTNVCLILGVAGAHASATSVRLAGFASLLAGAFSMAAGEWVSVRSQVELFNSLIDEIRRLIARNPKLVLDELSDRLEEAGLGRATAQTAAAELPLAEERFLSFTARTMFGVNPDELGSPLTAAGTSFLYFSLGAVVPLLPWLVLRSSVAQLASIALTGAASVIVGAVVARSSERPARLGGVRQLGIVLAAAAVTYGLGHLVGATVG